MAYLREGREDSITEKYTDKRKWVKSVRIRI